MTTLRALPLRELVRLHRAIRRRYFAVPWPERAPSVTLEHNPAQIDAVLRGRHHFEPGETFSYHYEGELLNLRRPEGVEDVDGRPVQMQGHIRARKAPVTHIGGWEYAAHLEPDPDAHPRLHINEVGFRWSRDYLLAVLDTAGFETPA